MKRIPLLIILVVFSFFQAYSQQNTFPSNGNAGIGKTSCETKVDAPDWPDYVFEEGYPLMSISQLREYIQKNKHLPNVPDAKTIQEEGVNLAEMDKILLEKIEELTLYILQQEKRISELEQELKKNK